MMRRSRRVPLLAGLLVALGATALWAHDFWLVPDAFSIVPGGEFTVRGQTSSKFPTSESAVAIDRIASAVLIDANATTPLQNLSHSGTSLVIRQSVSRAIGQRIVAVALHPRLVRESPESFRRYLVLEGAPEALERYQREGRLPVDSVTRRYAKYAKTLVEVGRGGPGAFDRIVGHPAELVPLVDPRGLAVGDSLPVRLLFRGQPVAGAKLHAGAAAGDRDPEELVLATDAAGVIRIPLVRSGLWNSRGIHIVPADPGSGADWDVHWVTLVFQVAGRP